ncbi:NAD(P)/FAD-dependent oxidoreductase [Saccharothrix variisporea]|uniref:Oxygen-dependent protoporphyrinogen oxidase n=1 Tax=Saccharothrix variisporea TaxID=543527 RepID=A0A495X1W9_9PSEU|nr:NAD(P)/FAD-dependent oxidoreductase [Saccharothrix variisporea]RKT67496.1 oxygen-dependent protoporphyrinogen oxidase [Saccharothrix variisporea]
MSADADVVVVGAGAAGLAAAHELRRAGREVLVLEAADRVGGRMATLRRDGFVIDTGAEQIPERGYDATWRLLADVGLGRDAVPRIGRYVAMWRDGRARLGVAHPRGLLTGAGLPLRARLDLRRLLRGAPDLDHPERGPAGTVAEVTAAYHPDVLEHLCGPVVTGFFGWRPDRSAAAPFLALMASIGPSSTWRTYRDGMDTLARALADRLDVTTSTPVREVVADRGSVRLTTAAGTELRARSVVLAVPAPAARALHANPGPDETPFLEACTFTPMVKVHLLLDRRPASRTYLVAVPATASRTVSTILFDHLKHPDRAPAGRGLVTLIAHPDLAPALLDAPDAEAVDTLGAAAERFVPGLRAATRDAVVHRFRHGLPEATPAALALRADFAARPVGPVDYAGDWVGLVPCSEVAVRSGRRAAARVLTAVPRRQPA